MRRLRNFRIFLFLASFLGFLATGCATQSRVKEIPSSLYGGDISKPTAVFNSQFKPVIELRYLAGVDDSAFDVANDHYMVHELFSAGKSPKEFDEQREKVNNTDFWGDENANPDAMREAIYKTHYAALELYKLLDQQLRDRAHIILSPNRVDLADDGLLTEVFGCDCPPAAIVIDFFAYVEPVVFVPGGWFFGGAPRSTSAQFLHPILSISTQRYLSPETHGLLAAPTAFKNIIDPGGDAGAEAASADIFQLMHRHELWQDNPVFGNRMSEAGPIEQNKVLIYPDITLMFSDLESTTSLHEALYPIAIASARALNRLMSEQRSRLLWADYVLNYDPNLAAVIREGQSLDDHLIELDSLIRQFYDAEIEFLGARDERYYELMMQGDFSTTVHAIRVAEQERNRKAQLTQAFAVAAAQAAVPTTTPVYAIAGAMKAALDDIDRTYESSFAEFEEQQFVFSTEIQGVTYKIQSTTPGGLRSELKRLYGEVTRSHGDQ